LQCVAVRCSALQCVAVRCSALQCVAVCNYWQWSTRVFHESTRAWIHRQKRPVWSLFYILMHQRPCLYCTCDHTPETWLGSFGRIEDSCCRAILVGSSALLHSYAREIMSLLYMRPHTRDSIRLHTQLAGLFWQNEKLFLQNEVLFWQNTGLFGRIQGSFGCKKFCFGRIKGSFGRIKGAFGGIKGS